MAQQTAKETQVNSMSAAVNLDALPDPWRRSPKLPSAQELGMGEYQTNHTTLPR